MIFPCNRMAIPDCLDRRVIYQKLTGFVDTIIPDNFTIDNYVSLLKNENGVFPFVNWLVNTLIVSVLSTVISTIIIIMMSYVLSRLKFAFRKPFLQIALVLGMFPGFMSMIALDDPQAFQYAEYRWFGHGLCRWRRTWFLHR